MLSYWLNDSIWPTETVRGWRFPMEVPMGTHRTHPMATDEIIAEKVEYKRDILQTVIDR